MLTPKKRVAGIATAFLTALALGACGDDGDGGSEAGEDPHAVALRGARQRDGHGLGRRDQGVRGRPTRASTVEFEEKGFEQIQKTAPMVLNSDDAPDLHGVQQGQRDRRPAVQAGPAHRPQRRGHQARLGQAAQPQRADHRAVRRATAIMGSGKWYGIPNYAEYVMVYYNKDLFEKHGVEVPTTLRRVRRGDGHLRRRRDDAAGHRPAPSTPPSRYLYQLALSQGRPVLGGRLPALQGQGRLPGRRLDLRRARPSPTGWRRATSPRTSTGVKAEDMGVALHRRASTRS